MRIFIGLILFCNGYAFCQNTVTDNSGNVYKTVKIGAQIWMAENLRTEKFNNGDPIEQITSNRYWQEITFFAIDNTILEGIRPAMCYYSNSKLRDNALYNWYCVIDSRGVCPVGWHIPSSFEFVDLVDYLGGLEKSLSQLKSQSSWKINGSNSSGFNAKGVGGRVADGSFVGASETTGFWTDTQSSERNEYNNSLLPLANMVFINNQSIEFTSSIYNTGNSIRCVKN